MTVGLSACQNDQELIKSSTREVLDAFKNPTEENLKPYMDEVDQSTLDEFEKYGIDPYEFMGHAFKHFDYEIKDVQVDGDKATVKLSVTNVSLQDAINTATEELQQEVQDDPTAFSTYQTDQKAYLQAFFDKIYDALDNATDTTTTDTELTLTKKDGTWEVDESSLDDFLESAYGGTDLNSLSS